MTSNQTAAADQQDPVRALLDTLIERWQEVADTYEADHGDHGDLNLKFDHFRTIYLRLIRDLRHVLDTGQMPCALMTDEERGRGECGHVHEDPWAAVPPNTASRPTGRIQELIVAHVCDLLLDHKTRGDQAARDLTWSLKREGVDLAAPIRERIGDLTLGAAPEVPF